MAEIVFVTPASGQASVTPAPSALGLLNHNVHPVVGGDQAIAFPASSAILIVDARSDLAAARATCQLLVNSTAGWPLLLLIPASGLSVVAPDWHIQDFILDDAGPAEFDARIKLLMATASSGNVLSAGPVIIDEDGRVDILNVVGDGHLLRDDRTRGSCGWRRGPPRRRRRRPERTCRSRRYGRQPHSPDPCN